MYLPPLIRSAFLPILLPLFVLPCQAYAGDGIALREDPGYQDGRIRVSGTVRDKSGEPLPGVSVLEKGTTSGTVTSISGEYAVEVRSSGTLVYSFVGFRAVEVPVSGQTIIHITMEEEVLGLDEVVVTAMGIRSEKRKLNFAVQSVDSEDLNTGRQTNFVDALQGRVAGIEVLSCPEIG